ncbi:hypothetical protein D3C87_1708850 [compost metagenome]
MDMVRHAHAPGEHSVPGPAIGSGDAFNGIAREAAGLGDIFPSQGLDIALEGRKAGPMGSDEIKVGRTLCQHGLCQPLEERDVRADARLQIIRGDLAAALEHGDR